MVRRVHGGQFRLVTGHPRVDESKNQRTKVSWATIDSQWREREAAELAFGQSNGLVDSDFRSSISNATANP